MSTKQYLRFTNGPIFGLIASSTARILQLENNKRKNYVGVPAAENVFVWNLQTKEKVFTFHGESSYVTCLNADSCHDNIAVGYADGIIKLFNSKCGTSIVSFCGHKSAVSCLAYDEEGLNLASGGKDSEIVIWSIVDQSGLFRLKGHKGPITKCCFLKQRNILISSSKDTYMKLWDLATQHCFQTLVGNRNEILDFVIVKGTRIIVGGNGTDLKVWDIFLNDNLHVVESSKKMRLDISEEVVISEEKHFHENEDGDEKFKCINAGKLLTVGDTTVCLVVDKTERVLGCHASTKVLQMYKILNSEEIAKQFQKRKWKENGKREHESEHNSLAPEITVSLVDEFQALPSIRTNAKIDSFSLTLQDGDIARIAVLLKNNSILQYQLDISKKGSIAELCHNIVLPGHRSTVHSLDYSSDNFSVMSVSEESVKIWKKFQEQEVCTQTLSCGAALCSVFAFDDNHSIIGTKNGELDIFEINAQQLVGKIQSHDGAVNCLCASPDKQGIASGSKDKRVKFWNYELLHHENYSQTKKRLSLSLRTSLQMPEEVLCLKYSPDKKKIAVSLLDCTVQVLFVDSLKLMFSLYGHNLPVTCMDISYDSTLIVTGSEDKAIRIWSMEFGSCNKYIQKAHEKGLTCLHFLPKTHMFFTGGRDYAVKQWDADNFQKIITLKGHQNEVSAMTVSHDGLTVLTASKDRSIRTWEKTKEPLVLEEEQEKEREEEEEIEDLPPVPGEVNKEAALPGFKTTETLTTVEQLVVAIDIYKEEVLKLQEHDMECKRAGKELPAPAAHPLLMAFSTTCPVRYMRKAISKIKSSELEGILLYLPLNYVLDFLKILCEFVEREWETEFCERCSSFLIRIHMGQMLSSQNFQPVIEKLKEKLCTQIYSRRDIIGLVKVTCQLQQRAMDALEEVPMFTSILDGLQQKKKKTKRKLTRSIVSFT